MYNDYVLFIISVFFILIDQVFLPELLHNLDLLVDKMEHDIIQTDRQYHYNQDLVVNLTHEKGRLEEEIIGEDEQIEKLTDILTVIDR